MKRLSLILMPLLLLVAGCGVRVLPQDALTQVDPSVDYEQVKSNPERYRGSTLLLGGEIIENSASEESSILEVLRYHLNGSGYPIRVDENGGRFLVVSDRFLDPEIYEKGRLLTLTGTVIDAETRPLNGHEYTYPLFRLESSHLWLEDRFRGNYYTPYYSPFYGPSPYWYDPFWYDPLWYRYPSHRYYPYW